MTPPSTSPPYRPSRSLPLLMSLVTIVPSETPMEFVRDPIGTGPYVMSNGPPASRSCSTVVTIIGVNSPQSPRRPMCSAPSPPFAPACCFRRSRYRAADYGRNCRQQGARFRLSKPRDRLPPHRQPGCADQRHPRPQGAECRHRPRGLHRTILPEVRNWPSQ